jgi:hypothetical protein
MKVTKNVMFFHGLHNIGILIKGKLVRDKSGLFHCSHSIIHRYAPRGIHPQGFDRVKARRTEKLQNIC